MNKRPNKQVICFFRTNEIIKTDILNKIMQALIPDGYFDESEPPPPSKKKNPS